MMIDEDYKNVSVFAIESQSEDEFTRDRSVLHTQMNICSYFLYISRHFLTLIDTRMILLPKCNTALRFSAYNIFSNSNESLNAISSARVLLFTFLLMARKLYFILLQGTIVSREDYEGTEVYLIGTCRNFCVLCQHMSYM